MNKIEAGTKIIITTPWASETEYKKGDILTVEMFASPGVYVEINGNRVYIASDEFEVYAEPEFKVGDRVVTRVANTEWDYEAGVEGTVTHMDCDEPKVGVSDVGYVYTSDLKLATPEPEKELLNVTPRSIDFSDIQEGDLIKAEYIRHGVKYAQEGLVDSVYDYGNCDTASGGYVARRDWNATYTLLERPEPPKPNPFAEANVGSLATYGGNGVKYLKEAENKWTAITDRGDLLSFGNTDADMLDNGNAAVTYNA